MYRCQLDRKAKGRGPTCDYVYNIIVMVVFPFDDITAFFADLTPVPFAFPVVFSAFASSTSNRVFGCMKGATDGGLDVPHNEKRFPGYDRDSKSYDVRVLPLWLFVGWLVIVLSFGKPITGVVLFPGVCCVAVPLSFYTTPVLSRFCPARHW